MFDKIKTLGVDTLIYGISTIVGRFLGFLLVPIYTHVLTPDKYGIVAIVFSYIALLNIFYSYGMESSYFRFAAKIEGEDSNDKYATPIISLFFTSILFSSFLIIFNNSIADLIQIDDGKLIIISALIIFFDTMVIIPFASLRLNKKSKKFVTIRLINIILNVVLNIYTLFVLKLEIEGIFYSNLISSFVTFLILTPSIIADFKGKFSITLYKEMLHFGLPYIPVGISSILLQVVDRPILKTFLNDYSVGIYQASFKLGVLMNLFTLMFEYAWRPFYLTHAKDLDAKNIFSKVFTYYLIISLLLFLVFSIFINDLVSLEIFGRNIISKKYWSGLGIVPIIFLGYLFTGCGMNFNAGIQIMKKTKSLIWTAILGAIVSIVGNFILIPYLNIYGAALSFMFGTFVSTFGIFIISQKHYKINYEVNKIFKIISITIFIFGIYQYFQISSLLIKSGLILSWIIFIYLFNIFSNEELNLFKNKA